MDFSTIVETVSDYLPSIPIYIPIISFTAVFLVFVINKKHYWKVPKLALLFVLLATAYEIYTKVTGSSGIIDQFKSYFTNSDYSSDFFYIFLPVFIYTFLFAILFSIFDKIRNKIEVRIKRLPR